MNELRLPAQASSVSLQSALTRTLDAVCAYRQAANISHSTLLARLCEQLGDERNRQAEKIADLIRSGGAEPDFGFSREAGFQQMWMCLVNRRFPTFREGLPRECERSDLRLERVLVRLCSDPSTGGELAKPLGEILREVRSGMERLNRLREPSGGLTAATV